MHMQELLHMCFLCVFEAQMQQDACLCAQCMRALHAAVYTYP
jgi:hypothetical protein